MFYFHRRCLFSFESKDLFSLQKWKPANLKYVVWLQNSPTNNQNLVVQTYSIFRKVGRKGISGNLWHLCMFQTSPPDWDLCMFSPIAKLSLVQVYSYLQWKYFLPGPYLHLWVTVHFPAVGTQRINNFLSKSVITQSLDKIRGSLTDSRAALPLNKCESFTYVSALLLPRRSSHPGPCALVQCFLFMADCLNSAAETCVALLVQRDRSQRAAKATCHFDDFIPFHSQLFVAAA